MEVILISDVEKLGLKGEVVDVKRGYARNYLLPRRLAEVATPGRIAEIRRIDEERARHEARSADQAAEIADTLTKTVLRFEVKAGETGALFGSVTPTDIAEELWRTRKIRVDRRKIDLDVIKRIGRYSIPVHVFEGVTAEVKTLVVPEGGELPPEEELAALEAAERAEAEAAEAAHAEALRETEAALAEEDALRDSADPDADTDAETPDADELPGRRARGDRRAGRGLTGERGDPLPISPHHRPHAPQRQSGPVDKRTKTPQRAAARREQRRATRWTTVSGSVDIMGTYVRSACSGGCEGPRAALLDTARHDGFDPPS